MKHDWNTWLKNRILREARHEEFEFEEDELQVGPHLINVKFIVNADWNKEEPQTMEYPGSPGHWEWDIEKILEVRPEGLNIPENEIIDSLRKRLRSKYDAEMQERLSDEARERSPEPDWDLIGKEKKYRG